ncbi:YraN family protein [Flavihumibacter rivuli]|uniref:YraN family protein n=1 Tax=Flavihumibacter rivuli TaxID=2838156 RepID=UPI001BDF3847|nr:YraN family protein [Flavihumibacter rivuli]ULQ56891.1 YraN family protein [Flavihumibacter rivuli]
MGGHIQLGNWGEELACAWLLEHSFTILHRNWRHSHYELDIIASRNGVLHFIEVKTRRGNALGWPEEDVTPRKLNALMNGAIAYLEQHPSWTRIQYDILAINLHSGGHDCYLVEDISL